MDPARHNPHPSRNASGKAGQSDVHLVCACCDRRAKLFKHLPRAFKQYSGKAVEKTLLADPALRLSRERQADVDAGLVPEDESNADGGSVNGNGDAGDVKEEGAGDKSDSLARMTLGGQRNRW